MKPVVKQIYLKNENINEDGHPLEASQLHPIATIGSDSVNVTSESGSTIVFVNGTNRGRVKLNDKGNMSIESDSKHVNIEAAKGLQLKPTTNITFDSSRRMDAGKGNEVHLQFLDDDHDPENPDHGHDKEKYAEVKYEGRSHDIRCFEHGGIALQPCGSDNEGHENKIKFESSRINELGEEGEYGIEGGKGLEFGTFNNLHSSLYTGDYRIKDDAPLMPVTRGDVTTVSGKSDYPTQGDDFKDIPLCYKLTTSGVIIKPCTWDDVNKTWTLPTDPGYTKLETTIKEISLLVNVIKQGGIDFGDLRGILLSLNQ